MSRKNHFNSVLAVLLTLCFALVSSSAMAQGDIEDITGTLEDLGTATDASVPDQILVKLASGDINDVITELGGTLLVTTYDGEVHVLEVVPAERDALLDAYNADSRVAYAEKNQLYSALHAPGDLLYPQQWNFHNAIGGIFMEDAWDLPAAPPPPILPPPSPASSYGDPLVVVAVVDTGVAYEVWSDASGDYFLGPDLVTTNFVPGYDFVNGDAHPNDDHGHGTHMTGTIAQSTDFPTVPYEWGAAGIAPGVTVMPMKALDGLGLGTTVTVANCINWAVANGANVINLSLGSAVPSFTVEAAVLNAYMSGVVVVAASGNSGGSVDYPAAYPTVIAVGATDALEGLTSYSNSGPEQVVVAPGGDITVDVNGGGDGFPDGIVQETFQNMPPMGNFYDFSYLFAQGTSSAAAHVSGVAALIVSAGITDPDEVRSIIEVTAKDLGAPGWDSLYGSGLVNAGAAIASAYGTAPIANPNGPYVGNEGSPVTFDATASSDPAIAMGIIYYEWDFGDPNDLTAVGIGPSPAHTYAEDSGAGSYTVTLTVTDDGGLLHSATTTATIANLPPVVNVDLDPASPPHPSGCFLVGETVSIVGDFTDPGTLDTHTGIVYWGDGSPGQVLGAVTSPIGPVGYAYSAAGTYTITLAVTDDEGDTGTDMVVDVCVKVPVPPMANPNGPYEDDEGDVVAFSGSGSSDADGVILKYEWNLGNGDVVVVEGTIASPPVATLDYVYRDNNEPDEFVPFTVTLTVTDDDDLTHSLSTLALIRNVDPLVSCCGVVPTGVAPDPLVYEGDLVTFTGCFTDAGLDDEHDPTMSAPDDGGSVQWDFGDGSAPVVGGPEILTITHIFADEGTYDVTLTVEDDDEGVGTTTCPVVVTNAPPDIDPNNPSDPDDDVIVLDAGPDDIIDEGEAVTFTIGFTDPGTDDDHTIVWDMGDGTTYPTAITSGSLQVTHTFADGPGGSPYTVSVTVDDGDGGSDTATLDVNVANVAPAVYAGTDVTIVEGDSVSLPPATFTDPGVLDTHTATIDWGEGAGPEAVPPANLTEPTSPGTVAGTNVYEDDGEYTVTVKVTDNDGDYGEDSFLVTVTNALPIVDAGEDQAVDEGDLVTVTASFTDLGDVDGQHIGTISWGDSTQPYEIPITTTTAIGTAEISGTLTATHVYADDLTRDIPAGPAYEVIVTVTDKDGGVGADSLIVTVSNVPPTITPPGIVLDAGSDGIVDEGETVSFSIGFTDPGSGDDHTIQWNMGDGTLIPAEITSGSLSVTHSYDDNGVYTVSVTVTDDDGGEDTEDLEVTVANVAPTVDAGPDDSVPEGAVYVFNGSFTDPSPVDTHGPDPPGGSAVVDWGDGQTGTATVDPSTRTTQANHVYADGPNVYTVTLTVTDDDDGVGSDQMLITVVNEVPCAEAGPDQTVNEGDVVYFSGSFDDPAGAADEPYTVEWDLDGDGVFEVTGTLTPTHIYPDNGIITVTLRVTDKDGGVGIDTLEVTVLNVTPVVDAGADQEADEGDIVTVDATFTDAGTADTHVAGINWNDGTPEESVFVTQGAGSGSLSATHVYADNGVYTVTVLVEDDDGAEGSDTLLVTVSNVAPVANAGDNWSIYEGEDIVIDNEGFGLFDMGIGDTHDATIDWGDGSATDSGVIVPDNNPEGPPGSTAGKSRRVTGAHTYNSDDGDYTVTLTVTDKDGASGVDYMVVVVQNVAPTVNAGEDQTITEGDTAQFGGIFTDPAGDADADFLVEWTFGDGGTFMEYLSSVSAISAPTHLYRDDGVYPVTMRVTDKDSGVGIDTMSVTVLNANPVVYAGPDQTVNEADTVSVSATFTDAGPDDTHTARIDWGDETVDDPATVSAGTVTGTHVYPDGPVTRTVLVTVIDDDGGVGTDTLIVTVLNVAPTVEAGEDQTADEGDTVSISATFTDPGAAYDEPYTATINWDDGTTDTINAATSPMAGSHPYADDGVYTVTVTVTDKDGGVGTDTLTVTVNNVAPVVEAGADQTVNEGDVVNISPTFTDVGVADTHSAVIDWGDGTSDTVNPATSPIATSHVYADNAEFLDYPYTVMVTVTDDDGGIGTDTLMVTVNNLPPVVDAGADQQADAGIAINLAPATFNDPGTLDTHTATIDWGDGTSEDGTVTETPTGPPGSTAGTDGTVDGSHAYEIAGTYTVTVTVSDDDCFLVLENNGGTPSVDCSGSDTLTVEVAANVPVAVAAAAPSPVAPEADVTFDHFGSYHDSYYHDLVKYEWDFESDGTYDYSTTYDDDTPTHAYPLIPGVLSRIETATLRVTDDNDPAKTDTDVVEIEVVFPNHAPVADADGPYVTELGNGIALDGSGSYDPDKRDFEPTDSIVSYGWDLNDDGYYTDATGPNPVVSGSQLAALGVDTAGVHPITLKVTDSFGATGTDNSTLTLEAPQLMEATYDVLTNILTLTFDKLVVPDLTCIDYIGMEIGDTGNMDAALSDDIGLVINQTSAVYTLTMDINRSIATVKNLALAHFAQRKRVDAFLLAGTVTNRYGGKSLESPGDVRIQITPPPGDVSGNGAVSALDASMLLRYGVGLLSEFPISSAANALTGMLSSLGADVDVETAIADVDGNGEISAYDAAIVLRMAAGLPSLAAPPISSSPKVARLNVNDCDSSRLELSIDLSNVKGVYSADIVMTYDPSTLRLADVSGTAAVADWLSADRAESGKLRISLAGASEPVSNGSFLTVSFDGDGLSDAIKQVDITELKLNGGNLKVKVENLPKTFALLQNYPNPFNPETWIPYQLSEPANVSISIYNLNGQMVRHLELGSIMPGHYTDKSRSAYWDGRNEFGEAVSSGVYFYQLQAGRDASVRKMIIVK